MNGFTGIVKHLIILNVIIFFAFKTSLAQPYTGNLLAYFFSDQRFSPYQIVTHMFMHADEMHLIMNMMGLFFLGPVVERHVGQKNFFILYFVAGLGAIGLRTLMQYLGIAGLGPALGASGAVLGVVTAFATLYPNQPLQLLFIPIPIKAKYMVAGFLALDLYAALSGSILQGVAHWAHIGGALTGFIITFFWLRNLR